MQPVLETERLRLRPFAEDMSDAEALNEVQSDAEHMRYYPAPFDIAMTNSWIRGMLGRYETDGFGLWVVEDAQTGQLLGNCGPCLQIVDEIDEIELGWSITPRRARQGIASEAATACRDWCFENLEIDHLISLVRPENVPSRGVAEKIGMTVWKETIFGSINWLHLVYRINRPSSATSPVPT